MPEATPRLFLFDIDGTLLHTRGAGTRAMQRAFQEVLHTTPDVETGVFAGRTDLEILHTLLHQLGVPDASIPELRRRLIPVFIDALKDELSRRPPQVLPGVPSLLERLQACPDCYLALVTGNLRPAAYLKLAAAGLDTFFPTGAFGSDALHRDALPPLALERARKHYNLPETVIPFVIGDTPRDIRCGHTIGARTVAVCTGPYSCEELAAHSPDTIFPDFRDTERVWKVLTGNTHEEAAD